MEELLERIALYVKARYPLLYLLSYEEERVLRALEKLGNQEGFEVWRWRVSEGLRSPKGEVLPATKRPTAAMDQIVPVEGPALFVFEDLHIHLGNPEVVRRVRDIQSVLGERRQAIVVVSPVLEVPQELEKDLTVLDVPLPGREEIGRLLKILLRRQGIEMEPVLFTRYVQTSLGLTEREVKRAFARILLGGGRFEAADLRTLVEVKIQAIRRTQGLEFVEKVISMDDVGGLDNLKEWLRRRSLAFGEEARRYGLPEPKGVFLLGVQGCGKSLTAKGIAGLFGLPLLRLDVGAVFQSAGSSEGTLRDAIRIAESLSPVVLWIDELEKGFQATSEQGGGRAFGTFLTWLQEKEKPVFVVATANEVRMLPPELLRKGRFDEIFFVDLPDVHERLAVLEIHVRGRDRSPERFDMLKCAEESEKYSGAELEQVVVEAMFDAFAERREMTDRDLLRVIRESVPLAVTMDDRLKELREWARPRTRPATLNRRRIDFFEDFEAVEQAPEQPGLDLPSPSSTDWS
jgi:AAA+ superfamily predicted ATPase